MFEELDLKVGETNRPDQCILWENKCWTITCAMPCRFTNGCAGPHK